MTWADATVQLFNPDGSLAWQFAKLRSNVRQASVAPKTNARIRQAELKLRSLDSGAMQRALRGQ